MAQRYFFVAANVQHPLDLEKLGAVLAGKSARAFSFSNSASFLSSSRGSRCRRSGAPQPAFIAPPVSARTGTPKTGKDREACSATSKADPRSISGRPMHEGGWRLVNLPDPLLRGTRCTTTRWDGCDASRRRATVTIPTRTYFGPARSETSQEQSPPCL